MKITAILGRGGRTGRVAIQLDDGSSLDLAEELSLREGLHVGDPLTEARRAELSALDTAWRARDAALRLLAHRPRTVAELRDRLRRRGFPHPLVERTLDELRERRLLDDEAYARSFVRDGLRGRPRGARRLAAELGRKGIGAAEAGAAITEVLESEAVSELDLAGEAARRWSPRPGEDPLRARRRLYAYLARRGFSAETIAEILADPQH